jgi:hypothetical protein
VLCGNNRDCRFASDLNAHLVVVPDDVMFLKKVMTESKGRCHDEYVF